MTDKEIIELIEEIAKQRIKLRILKNRINELIILIKEKNMMKNSKKIIK